ncbi:nucleotidyltransferase domain-containing protein [Chitinophagales bacterium]|nr:nucleotidyltransferase domain-containing protein [Chitinophagales bacterium]
MRIQDLKDRNLLLLDCVSGSRAYGLATPQSDWDYKGVYYLPKEDFFSGNYVPQIANETNDEVYYELGRFVDLLVVNNPGILELLASPKEMIRFRHPIMDKIKLEDFLSQLCQKSFGGYAETQIRKARGLNKKILNPVEKERKTVFDFCFILKGNNSVPVSDWLTTEGFLQESIGLAAIAHFKNVYAVYSDSKAELGYRGIVQSENANQISLSSIPKGEQLKAYLYFNLEGYSTYCKKYKEYWSWVEKRNEQRYQTNEKHGKGYDSKNMMHTFRLLDTAIEIIRDGNLNVLRGNREELLTIKSGNFEYDYLLNMADQRLQLLEEVSKISKLAKKPNQEMARNLLIAIRKELYD